MKKSDELAKLLIEAKEAYYSTETNIMSDSEFDAIEDELRRIDPEHDYFSSIGSSPVYGEKIRHRRPMLSMQKAKTISELEKWITKLKLSQNESFCVQPKIDGLSATLFYENGKLKYAATRGDGQTGQIITRVADHISDMRHEIRFTDGPVEIRGELYLPKNTEFDTGGRPLRNNCVGLINRKENTSDLKHVRFVAYQIEGMDFNFENEKIDLLRSEEFNTVEYFTASGINDFEKIYDSYIGTLRDRWLFETDGLIVTVNRTSLFDSIDSRWVVDHHHHYSIALKPPAESRKTRLIRIEWQISRQGNIIPVAVFTPVTIGGAKIERATLSNAANVKQLRLAEGDELLIERANDVIPYIKENLSDNIFETGLVISSCPSCKTALIENGVHIKCPNSTCPEVNIQKILFWVKESEMENISEATVRKLYELKIIQSIKDLYTLKSEDLDIPGFADKKIANFLSEAEKSRKMPAVEFISKLGIPLVQSKTLIKLGIKTIEDFYSFSDSAYIVGKNIIEWKSDSANMIFFNELLSAVEITENRTTGERGKICCTGKGPLSRKDLADKINGMGYEFTDTFSKDIVLLLCDDPASGSSKIQKAEKNGIPIKSYTDFFSE